jgi:hypothetical protein
MATSKNPCRKSFPKGALLFAALLLVFVGCAAEKKHFDESVKGAQVIVEPDTLHLGVVRMLTKDISFRGRGFIPNEGYCVYLRGDEERTRSVDVPICCGVVDEKGAFDDKAKTLVKADYLLNADFTTGKKGYLVIINKPPVPEGKYKAVATGFDSKIEAQTPVIIKGPTLKDHVMDWVGQLLGKVKKE